MIGSVREMTEGMLNGGKGNVRGKCVYMIR